VLLKILWWTLPVRRGVGFSRCWRPYLLFIFLSNLVGLVPGFFPPTGSLNTTLACAFTVVVFTHVIGVMYHGIKYIKHFMGPVWWMVPIIYLLNLSGILPGFYPCLFDFSETSWARNWFWALVSVWQGHFSHRFQLWSWAFCLSGAGIRIFPALNYVLYRSHGTRPLISNFVIKNHLVCKPMFFKYSLFLYSF
jgi:hypothetical protein